PGVRHIECDIPPESAMRRHLERVIVRVRAEAIIRRVGVAREGSIKVRLVGGRAVELRTCNEGILVLRQPGRAERDCVLIHAVQVVIGRGAYIAYVDQQGERKFALNGKVPVIRGGDMSALVESHDACREEGACGGGRYRSEVSVIELRDN